MCLLLLLIVSHSGCARIAAIDVLPRERLRVGYWARPACAVHDAVGTILLHRRQHGDELRW